MAAKSTSRQTSETKIIKELAEILNETDLSEIEMRKGDLKIRVSKHGSQTIQAYAPAPAPAAPAPASAPSAPAAPAAAPETAADVSNHPGAVKSPMVGTAYVRPSPDADSFVNEGDSVKEGDTVLLIEAMKTFNPITAPRSGTITKVLVEDAAPVEFGEPLFILE